MSENFDKFMDLPFLRGLVSDPFGTSDKARKFIRELPDKLDNSQIIHGLDALGKNNEEIAKGITDIILSDQRGYQDMSSGINDLSSSLSSSMDDMYRGLESGLQDLSSSMEAIYGGKLPQGKSMVELGQELSFQGKRTLIALAANGGVNDHQLEHLFHPNFVYYLRNGYSSGQVSGIQSNLIRSLYALQENKAKLVGEKERIHQQRDEIPEKSDNHNKRNELLSACGSIDSQISHIDHKTREIYQQLLPHDQIQLLDVGRAAKDKDIRSLIAQGFINRKSLELLIKSHQISGNMVAECANIAVKDKEGRIKPFVPLDGVVGILQETRINRKIGNVGIVQREEIKGKLDTIDESLTEGFDQTNQNLEYISDTLYQGFKETDKRLEGIGSSIDRIGEISYGIRLPEEKKISEIMENSGTAGKKTLLALYAKGLVDNGNDPENPLYRVFSAYFHEHLRKGTTSEEVKELCENKEEELKKLNKEYKKQYALLKSKNLSEESILEELTPLRDRMHEVGKGMITEEEIGLLDVYMQAKGAESITDLINMGLLDDKTLEDLVRHQKVDGDASLEAARIMKVDENGVTPKLDLDGDVGRRQQLKAQTIQGNIALRQRGAMIEHLQNINVGIEYMHTHLESINDQIMESNGYLYNILETNQETNTLLTESNSLLEEGNDLSKITNQLLAGIGGQIALTGNQIIQALDGLGDVIVAGFGQTLDVLTAIQRTSGNIQQLNQEMLHELQKQSELLSKPLNTQANEYFLHGMEMLGVGENPSKDDRKVALESFEKGLKLNNTHLLNLYGAGTAMKSLGKDKKAVTYLDRAYKFANKANNISLAKNIAMDLAKIYAKNLKLKVAKYRLDEVIAHDSEGIEAYLLKARITNILHQKEEFKVTLTLIYHKIIEEGKQIKVAGDYQDVLKYMYKPAKDMVDQHIQTGVLAKLLSVLPALQQIGHQEAVQAIVGSVIFQYPQSLLTAGIDARSIISDHKDYFEPLYKEHANKKFMGGISQDFFALAYLGYGSIDSVVLDSLITIGLEYDLNYIKLQNAPSLQEKQMYISDLQNKIYALGDKAKYMLRDYLKVHPDSAILR